MAYPFTDDSDLKALEIFDFDGDDEPEEQNQNTGFVIDTLSKADWAIKKIVAAQNSIKLKTEEAAEMKKKPLEEIARIDGWLKDETQKALQDIDSLSAMLMPFVAEQVEGKKKRSIDLPSGRAGFAKGTVTFFFGTEKASKDNQQLLEYLVDNNYTEFVKTEINELVDWAEFKKRLKVADDGAVINSDTGEVVDSMFTQQAPDTFKVLPPKDYAKSQIQS